MHIVVCLSALRTCVYEIYTYFTLKVCCLAVAVAVVVIVIANVA